MTNQVQVQTGFAFPSAGVRILIPLVVAAYIEKLARVSMHQMSDYNAGSSIGAMAAAAFSRKEAEHARLAKTVLDSTFVTAYAKFNRDAGTVAKNNLLRDLPQMRDQINNFFARSVLSVLEYSRPTLESGRYDPKILEAALKANFGEQKVTEIGKPFFAATHCLNDGRPTLFTNVDVTKHARISDEPLFMHTTPTHGDVTIVDAIMAATAIPGLIGHWHIPSLDKHFMDPGNFAAQSFYCVMQDMHDMTTQRLRHDHSTKLSARSVFQRMTGKSETPPRVVSRMILFGVGHESTHDFDRSNSHGMLPQIKNIWQAACDHGRGYAYDQIHTRFDKPSMAATGATGLRVIDSTIIPADDRQRETFPSSSIVDGQFDNLMKLMRFGLHVVAENSAALCDEVIMRMNELERRGEKTADEVEAITSRVNQYRSPEAALDLCEGIVMSEAEAKALLAANGLMPAAKPAADAQPPANPAGWRIPRLSRIAAAMSFF